MGGAVCNVLSPLRVVIALADHFIPFAPGRGLGGADPRSRKGSVSWNPPPPSSPSKVGRGPNVPLLHFLSDLRYKLARF